MVQHKHLSLPKIAECSMHPVYTCNECGRKLWSERSVRSGGREWLITEDNQRHFKSQCKVIPLKTEIDGKALKGE